MQWCIEVQFPAIQPEDASKAVKKERLCCHHSFISNLPIRVKASLVWMSKNPKAPFTRGGLHCSPTAYWGIYLLILVEQEDGWSMSTLLIHWNPTDIWSIPHMPVFSRQDKMGCRWVSTDTSIDTRRFLEETEGSDRVRLKNWKTDLIGQPLWKGLKTTSGCYNLGYEVSSLSRLRDVTHVTLYSISLRSCPGCSSKVYVVR